MVLPLSVLPSGHAVSVLRNGTAQNINYSNNRNLADRLYVYVF